MNENEFVYNDFADRSRKSGLEDLKPDNICIHQEHNPPMHIHIPQDKQYRHICPACGNQQIIKPLQISFYSLKGKQ